MAVDADQTTSDPKPDAEPEITAESEAQTESEPTAESAAAPFMKHFRGGETMELNEETVHGLIDAAIDNWQKDKDGTGKPAADKPAPGPESKSESAEFDARTEFQKMREELNKERQERQTVAQQQQLQAQFDKLSANSKVMQAETDPVFSQDVANTTWRLMANQRIPVEKAFDLAVKERTGFLARRDERILKSKADQAERVTESAGGSGSPSTGHEKATRQSLRDGSIKARVADRFRKARLAKTA